MTELGGYITRRRKQKGWSRRALSQKSGVPYSTLSNIERNENKVKPKEETLHALAVALEEEDDSQIRVLAGYDIIGSGSVSERAKRIDALMTVAPRWGRILDAIQVEYTPEEQDEALTQLEVHRELVRRRRRRS
jgi:transcriptional regulator with XRE-family HTH domain